MPFSSSAPINALSLVCEGGFMTTVLIIGSGPNALEARAWPRSSFDVIVAINNAWRVRADWDYLIHPEDFPQNRQPQDTNGKQSVVLASAFVPQQNRFGGFVYAGGTMAFTAAYWALGALNPSVIAMIGCDMTYAQSGPTHFYGNGSPDPLRDDITLRSLPAKSARLMALAAKNDCAMVNLSSAPSQLTFPRATHLTAAAQRPVPHSETDVAAALSQERDLGYFVPSGKYWEVKDTFDPAQIDALDAMWLALAPPEQSVLSNPPQAVRQCG